MQRSRVVDFDRERFESACAELLRLASHDGPPQVIVGIRTGGLHVANAMAKACGEGLTVLPLTCRRPSSRYKPGLPAIKDLVARLPRPVLDRLRMIEHALLTRRPPSGRREGYHFDAAELACVEAWAATAGNGISVLVVDDAVDSGTTLSLVLEAVQRLMPAARIRSAALTVTTAQPLVTPDYALYSRQLCRFPWSLDAKQPAA